MIGIGIPPHMISLSFDREVFTRFPEGIEAAKERFVTWLGRGQKADALYTSEDGLLVFRPLGNDVYHVSLA